MKTKRTRCEMNLTLRCQLQCTNCNRLCHLYPDRDEDEDMSLEQVRRFLSQLRASPVKISRLKLLGGEPLLHPEFITVLGALFVAVDEGLIEKIKIETNHVLPKPDVPDHPQIQWAGKSWFRKRHAPALWSPRDLGMPPTKGPCPMPRQCGFSIDSRGYSLCSVAIMLLRLAGREDLYRDEFPTDWRRDFAETIDLLCPDCIFSLPKQALEDVSFPLDETPPGAQRPTRTWEKRIEGHDGKPKLFRW